MGDDEDFLKPEPRLFSWEAKYLHQDGGEEPTAGDDVTSKGDLKKSFWTDLIGS